jgi:hypothetical protein
MRHQSLGAAALLQSSSGGLSNFSPVLGWIEEMQFRVYYQAGDGVSRKGLFRNFYLINLFFKSRQIEYKKVKNEGTIHNNRKFDRSSWVWISGNSIFKIYLDK